MARSDRYPVVRELIQGQQTRKQSHWALCSLLLTTTPSFSSSQLPWDHALRAQLGLHGPCEALWLLLKRCLPLPKHLCTFALAFPCLLWYISFPLLVLPPLLPDLKNPHYFCKAYLKCPLPSVGCPFPSFRGTRVCLCHCPHALLMPFTRLPAAPSRLEAEGRQRPVLSACASLSTFPSNWHMVGLLAGWTDEQIDEWMSSETDKQMGVWTNRQGDRCLQRSLGGRQR